jgi:hypothetical protein
VQTGTRTHFYKPQNELMETNVEDKDLLKARRPNDKEMDNFQYCYVEVMTVKKK